MILIGRLMCDIRDLKWIWWSCCFVLSWTSAYVTIPTVSQFKKEIACECQSRALGQREGDGLSFPSCIICVMSMTHLYNFNLIPGLMPLAISLRDVNLMPENSIYERKRNIILIEITLYPQVVPFILDGMLCYYTLM